MSIPCGKPTNSIRSILSTRRCIDLKTAFSDDTLFLTLVILAACCMINGDGASSSNWSSSSEKLLSQLDPASKIQLKIKQNQFFMLQNYNSSKTQSIELGKAIELRSVRRSMDDVRSSWLLRVAWAFESKSLRTEPSIDDMPLARASHELLSPVDSPTSSPVDSGASTPSALDATAVLCSPLDMESEFSSAVSMARAAESTKELDEEEETLGAVWHAITSDKRLAH